MEVTNHLPIGMILQSVQYSYMGKAPNWLDDFRFGLVGDVIVPRFGYQNCKVGPYQF